MDEIYRRLDVIFKDVFDDAPICVVPELTAADVPDWDSLSHIRLILSVQKEFHIKLSAAQTASFANVGELADLIHAKTKTMT